LQALKTFGHLLRVIFLQDHRLICHGEDEFHRQA